MISPLITAPWPIYTFDPIVTYPATVAFGAINIYPCDAGSNLYKGRMTLALDMVSEYFFGASIAFFCELKSKRRKFLVAKFFNMNSNEYINNDDCQNEFDKWRNM